MCGSRKYPYPPHRGSWEIQTGGEVLTKNNWNFQRGERVQTQKTSVGGGGGGGVWMFSGARQSSYCLICQILAKVISNLQHHYPWNFLNYCINQCSFKDFSAKQPQPTPHPHPTQIDSLVIEVLTVSEPLNF